MQLTPEFMTLAGVLILTLVQILLAATARTAELGLKWNAGARDGDCAPPGKLAGRLLRAQANLFETLPIFIAAILMAQMTARDGTSLTLIGSLLYLFGRLLYLPLYAFGVAYIRSLAWFVSLVGLVMLIAALFV
ncbi:MAPEG family protein [uncultured Brevundimonas sp.]|mgnify:FL=1|uniref:MAPEG family protein n=1 Tax=uncultured Brevundimonas sp. TaxID=213418 RepID=UPI0030EE9B7F|tara:strand:+ start:12041 stop:12442 length:402 start_codon:yes stop_codon:yes gene_type:complete